MSAALISPADIADAVLTGLHAAATDRDLEQATHGLDRLDEVALHPILADALRTAGYGVTREAHYPGARDRRRASEGARCDLVLTADGRPLRAEAAQATLFDDPDAAEPDDAYWLEVKTAAQFRETGANAQYSGQLLSVVTGDLTKLVHDDAIRRAALLLVLFVRDETVARHDLEVWEARCLAKGHFIAAPCVRGFALTDRLGNGWCSVALYPVR